MKKSYLLWVRVQDSWGPDVEVCPTLEYATDRFSARKQDPNVMKLAISFEGTSHFITEWKRPSA